MKRDIINHASIEQRLKDQYKADQEFYRQISEQGKSVQEITDFYKKELDALASKYGVPINLNLSTARMIINMIEVIKNGRPRFLVGKDSRELYKFGESSIENDEK